MSYSPSEDRPAGTVEMTMPETGSTEAAVVAWLKRPGDRVAEGEPVCLVAWDGVTAEVTSPATGVMRMVALATGHPAPTGSSLAVIDTRVLPAPEPEDDDPRPLVPDSAVRDAPVAEPEPVDLGDYLSPAVRRFSAERGIDPHSVAGTGRDGRVTLHDLDG